MNGWFNPDSWMDILSHFLLVVGAIGVAAVPSWFAARNHREIKDVKDQVVNGHKVPLRFDLDRVLERLEEVSKYVTDVGRGVAGLRTELADEEVRRRENVRELRSDMERNREEVRDGISHIERRLFDLERDARPK
jgi:predicted  nucleic acid-binding Zn-ribbon protein